MSKAYFQFNVDVSVEIIARDDAPDDVISRALTDEWRESFYDLYTEDDVADHLAYACIFSGVEDASRLDGWADLEKGMLTMRASR